MKNIFKILILLLLITGCDETEPAIYDNEDQLGVGFTDETISVIVPEEGVSTTANIQATQISSVDRTFNVTINEDLSFITSASDFSFGTATIPANSFDGTFDITFDNFENLEELINYNLVLNIEAPAGAAIVNSETVTFNYLKKIICNDFVLTINEDAFADERNWNITDSSGAIVVQCSDFATCPTSPVSGSVPAGLFVHEFVLPDGVYTFTITDTFGDGIFDGTITGNYSLDCSIINHASGSGNFGSIEETEFFVNQ